MAETGDRNEGDIEAELRPYVDRSLAPHAWRGSAIRARNAARWCEARAEPLPRLDGDALLARTEARIVAFWRGDHDADALPARWPLSDAHRAAMAGRPPLRSLHRPAGYRECRLYLRYGYEDIGLPPSAAPVQSRSTRQARGERKGVLRCPLSP